MTFRDIEDIDREQEPRKKMMGVYTNLMKHRVTIAGPNGRYWQFNGEDFEPEYESKRKRLISQNNIKELKALDHKVMDLLSDRIVNLAKELGCGIAMGDSSIEEREGITYGSCPDCKKTVDERARAKAIADYSNGNLNKEEPEVAPTCHICGDTMTPVTDFDSDGDGKK